MNPLPPLQPLERLQPMTPQQTSPSGACAAGFTGVLDNLLGPTSQADLSAGQAIEALAAGEIDDVHTVSLAVAQADLSLRMAVEVRNRLLEGYQEIIRLQI